MYLTLLYLTCRYLIYCLYPSVYTGFSATRLNPSIFLPIAIYSIFPKHPNHYLRYLPYHVKIRKLPGRYLSDGVLYYEIKICSTVFGTMLSAIPIYTLHITVGCRLLFSHFP